MFNRGKNRVVLFAAFVCMALVGEGAFAKPKSELVKEESGYYYGYGKGATTEEADFLAKRDLIENALKENKYEVHVATNGTEQFPYCDKKHQICIERSPFKLNNFISHKFYPSYLVFLKFLVPVQGYYCGLIQLYL